MANYRLSHLVAPGEPEPTDQQGLRREKINGKDYWSQDVALNEPASGTVDVPLTCQACGKSVTFRLVSESTVKGKALRSKLLMVAALGAFFIVGASFFPDLMHQSSLFLTIVFIGVGVMLFRPASQWVQAVTMLKENSANHDLFPQRTTPPGS